MKNEGACLGRARLKNGDFRDFCLHPLFDQAVPAATFSPMTPKRDSN